MPVTAHEVTKHLDILGLNITETEHIPWCPCGWEASSYLSRERAEGLMALHVRDCPRTVCPKCGDTPKWCPDGADAATPL